MSAEARQRADALISRIKAQHEAQAAEVKVLCDRLGYGFVMAEASRIWRKQDPMGAHMVGPCVHFTSDCPCRPGERSKCDRCHGCGWVFA